MRPKVAILLVNWNGKRFLEPFLPRLAATDYPDFEVVVWDNGSTDGSVEWLRKNHPGIRILEARENHGFTGGNNLGLRHLDAPLVALVNTDVEVTAGWLEPLVARMVSTPNAAAVQPVILSHAAPDRFEYAGAAGGYIDRWGYPFCRGRIFDDLEADEGQYDEPVKVFWASGACLLIRRTVVDQIGLFDDDYFAHWEEIDFCWRAQNAGFELWCEPRSRVFHVGGGTLQNTHPRKTYLNFRNSLATLTKNLPASEAGVKLAARVVLDAVVVVKALLAGKGAYARAVVKAQFDFWRNLPRTWKKRKGITQRPMRTLAGVWQGSVVWAYFVRKKRRFSDVIGSKGRQ